jgi:uncharacterized protein (TIGR03083 family)
VNIPSTLKVVRATTELLAEELNALAPEQWETPNACGDWKVAEVVAHLAGAGERYALYTRRALEGVSDPPGGSSFVTDRAAYSEGIKQRAIDYHRKGGENGAKQFRLTGLDLVELLESLEPGDWQRPAFHPGGVLPIAGLLGWRTAELSLHRWDILNVLGREAHLPDGSLEPIVDWLPRWLGIGFRATQPLPEPRRYLVVLGSPLLRLLKITVFGDRFEIDRQDDESADAVLTTGPETFILLAMGRYEWPAALGSGAVVVGGDRAAAAEFPRWFGSI